MVICDYQNMITDINKSNGHQILVLLLFADINYRWDKSIQRLMCCYGANEARWSV